MNKKWILAGAMAFGFTGVMAPMTFAKEPAAAARRGEKEYDEEVRYNELPKEVQKTVDKERGKHEVEADDEHLGGVDHFEDLIKVNTEFVTHRWPGDLSWGFAPMVGQPSAARKDSAMKRGRSPNGPTRRALVDRLHLVDHCRDGVRAVCERR